ncbi:ABC transporter ATP-binding protein [bacterium]|nr:ABC transporter ATP-binding protein [bacterium]
MTCFAIQTNRLRKVYQGELGQKDYVGLEGLDLEIPAGEVFAFLGPNGAGKTTTIKVLMRLLRPSSGSVMINGVSNTQHQSMERVGYLSEQPNIYGYLTAREFLDFIGKLFGLAPSVRRKRIDGLIGLVGLKDRDRTLIRGFSRGMTQRLGMAQALMNEPDILILDEPLSNLDPVGRKDMRDIILSLKAQKKTLFFSSHILHDAEIVADRVGILDHGRLVQTGTMQELMGSGLKTIEIIYSIPEAGESVLGLSRERIVRQGDRTLTWTENMESAQEILGKLLKNGGKVFSVTPQRQSLEDLFISRIRG